jgi:hypothetical protein
MQSCLVFGLVIAGSGEEAMVAANGLIEAAEATANPFMLSFAKSTPTASPSARPTPPALLTPLAEVW